MSSPAEDPDTTDAVAAATAAPPTPQDDQREERAIASDEHGHPLFEFMVRYPLPFLVIVPAVLALLLGLGWATTEDKVEAEVAKIWIAQDGNYAKDQDYAKGLGVDDLSSSSFAAMAISRDDKNLLTADRLEQVRARMEQTEATKIEYKGIEYTWDDLCAVNSAPYQFPCLRFSAMDLFLEARWTFSVPERVGYYRNALQSTLLRPRLARFGVLTQNCAGADQCGPLLVARQATPLALFSDLDNMEYNDPCRMCVETVYEATVRQIHGSLQPTFGVLALELDRYRQTLPEEDQGPILSLMGQLQQVSASVTTDDVVDFLGYYTVRSLYAQLGASSYMTAYNTDLAQLIGRCYAFGLTCPPINVTAAQAYGHLLAHADSTDFSSVNTAGSAFPFWSQDNVMFGANDGGEPLQAFSGSGVDMSAAMGSLAVYLNVTHYGSPVWNPLYGTDGFVVPDSALWNEHVAKNPLYSWFMASVVTADENQVCGNDIMPGSQTGNAQVDGTTAFVATSLSQEWCTPFNAPREPGQGEFTRQHFARMWYDLLIASPSFLDFTQGSDDPYSWTTGAGCDYSLGGERYSYTNETEADILHNASRIVYNIDEGVTIGAVDRNLLIGGAFPAVGDYNYENPLQTVTVLQSLYAALVTKDIVKRVQNCNRPGGSLTITEEDAEEILYRWKEAMEETWSSGWDDDSDGQVQFVSFFDDGGGTVGSTGRMMEAITLDNTKLTFISIALIAAFSVLFLFSPDQVESRILITLIGVGLAVFSFFAALGFALLVGIKINVTIAWTLPFVIIGLGVDDVYIILLALKKQPGYTTQDWLNAMAEVVVPVTMTSLVNASMFAVLNYNDIPAIYLTSRVACFCVIALYITVIFCYPAYCYYDFKRQAAGRADIFFVKVKDTTEEEDGGSAERGEKVDFRDTYLYEYFYKTVVLGDYRTLVHFIIVGVSAALFAIGIYGITERKVGLGLEDFFPNTNPASRWATFRTEELASWSVSINWGELEYTDPTTQMKMIKQFEDVVATSHIAEVDTHQLWMAEFAIWTSRHCGANFARDNFDQPACGYDQEFVEDGSFCSGTWVENDLGLREKSITPVTDPTCSPNEGGICRPGEQMHPLDLVALGLNETTAEGRSFCPVIADWSEGKWQFCLQQWRNITGSDGRFVRVKDSATETQCSGVYHNDDDLVWPLVYSSGPTMFSYHLFSHEETLDMMNEVRDVCDNDEELHCWMSGIPFDYWSQYEGIFSVLVELSAYATLTGFGIAFIFLLGTFTHEGHHSTADIFGGSLIGALLIAMTIICTLVPVVGMSIMAGVNLTGFSNMGFVLSVGFAVEYSVHIISRWMRADMSIKSSLERVEHTMSFLMIPTFMSFVSSTIGVVCLSFTEFEFNDVFFFRPLIIVMFMSYWFGCWFLPVVLIYLDLDMCKLGKPASGLAGKNLEDSSEDEGKVIDKTGLPKDDSSNGEDVEA